MDLRTLQKLKKIYQSGSNISHFLRTQEKSRINTPEIIQITYDFQAGSYIKHNQKDSSFITKWSKAIAHEIVSLQLEHPFSLLDAGIGEATTFQPLIDHLKTSISHAYGFDISWSRLAFGRAYLKQKKCAVPTTLFLADLMNIPLADNSVDVVYTSHAIEPNGGKEKEVLQELYRVTAKYLVLLEPDYAFASKAARQRIKQHKFITKLPKVAKELGYEIVTHRPFGISSNPLNPTGLLIVKKRPHKANPTFICPISYEKLTLKRDAYFSPKALLAYPIVDGIPCLLPQNAIIATHFDDSFVIGK